MAWLRIDDGFTEHPKLIALRDDKTRWMLMRILCHCARYRTDGHITPSTLAHLGATKTQITDLVNNGVLDLENNELHVHDWRDFNPKDPTAAERQSRRRSRLDHANVTHDVTHGVTVNVTPNVTEPAVTETVTNRDSRTDARARSRPVPSRPVENPAPAPSVVDPARDPEPDPNGAGAGAGALQRINPTNVLQVLGGGQA